MKKKILFFNFLSINLINFFQDYLKIKKKKSEEK